MQLLGRLTFPLSMFAYPFYLQNRSPGKEGSHYDPKTDLFTELEGPMVRFAVFIVRCRFPCTQIYYRVPIPYKTREPPLRSMRAVAPSWWSAL